MSREERSNYVLVGCFDAYWSREEGSNLRPAVYDTAALPTELSRHSYEKSLT